MFLFGVPLRFWIKRLLVSGEELSPQPWDFWGNVEELDLFLSLVFTSGVQSHGRGSARRGEALG